MDESFPKISERNLSLLFNHCVALSSCIRFAQSLKLHYNGLPLKLDIVKCRLGRWGTAVRGGSNQLFDYYFPEDSLEMMRMIFQGRQSNWLTNNHQTAYAGMSSDPVSAHLRDRLYTVTEERLFEADLIWKILWTIYDKKDAELLIDGCAVHIDELEKYIKFDARVLRHMAIEEVEEVRQVQALHWIQAAAQTVDSVLEDVAKQKLDKLGIYNFVGRVGSMTPNANLRIGDWGKNRTGPQ
ncbi:hypothetical protein FSARC_12986 [Fusarium sarcochroum]|uniref:Prion-inhibition and propagation HeLo domain-containing protein n=1 Tax=Fusarium sarcochroum TaxID=1208366 RepID=A0A8H4WUT2_9HYPO|nr:hypothetical protein FSARC_12986 [Fusarium sarcochroum]